MAEETNPKVIQDDEIDLVELAKTIWKGRKFIAKVTGIFALIGLVIAFTSPVEYEASCKLLPESQEAQMPNIGGLAGLAGLAGVDLSSMSGMNSGALTPEIYPEIVSSLPFILEVVNDTVFFEQTSIRTTSFYYFKEIQSPSILGFLSKYTIEIPALIKKMFTAEIIAGEDNSNFHRFSKDDWDLIEKFKKRISIEIDDETGIIKIIVSMPDPYAAAQLTKKVELMLTKAVITYKTDKLNENLKFVQEAFEEAKVNFEFVQFKLARMSDKNKNVSSELAQIELKKLKNEFDVLFSVYKGLAAQLEQEKINLKKETPVFTILEPTRVPEMKSRPKRLLILVVFAFLGTLSGSLTVILVPTIKAAWKTN